MIARFGLEQFCRDLARDLRHRSANAARRGKPTMWAYYLQMAHFIEWRFVPAGYHPTDEYILDAALETEQEARRICLNSTYPPLPRELSEAYSRGVYARRILRAGGVKERGWMKLWREDALRMAGAAGLKEK